MNTTEIIAAVAVVANIILLSIVILQRSDSIKQYKTINRPWLILGEGSGMLGDNYYNFHIENIGHLPAKDIRISSIARCYRSDNEEEYEIKEPKNIPIIGIVMPKQKHTFVIDYLRVDDMDLYSTYSVDITFFYVFGDEDKKCVFRLYVQKLTGTREITCLEAN